MKSTALIMVFLVATDSGSSSGVTLGYEGNPGIVEFTEEIPRDEEGERALQETTAESVRSGASP